MSAALFIILQLRLLAVNQLYLLCSLCVCVCVCVCVCLCVWGDNSARLIISHNYIPAGRDREEVGGRRRELLIW